jgi:hypothetical protein
MSAMGQKRPINGVDTMSALPPIAAGSVRRTK